MQYICICSHITVKNYWYWTSVDIRYLITREALYNIWFPTVPILALSSATSTTSTDTRALLNGWNKKILDTFRFSIGREKDTVPVFESEVEKRSSVDYVVKKDKKARILLLRIAYNLKKDKKARILLLRIAYNLSRLLPPYSQLVHHISWAPSVIVRKIKHCV